MTSSPPSLASDMLGLAIRLETQAAALAGINSDIYYGLASPEWSGMAANAFTDAVTKVRQQLLAAAAETGHVAAGVRTQSAMLAQMAPLGQPTQPAPAPAGTR